MRLPKSLIVIDGLLIASLCWSVISLTRMTHQIPLSILLGFLPTIAAFVALKSPSSRGVGGLAALLNALLAIAGLFYIVASLLGAMSRASVTEQVGFFVFAIFLLATGALNFKAVLVAFPAKGIRPGIN